MRWPWRSREPEPQRALPDDLGLPTRARTPAAPAPPEPDDADGADQAPQRSSATPASAPGRTASTTSSQPATPPLAAPVGDVERSAVAAAGEQLASTVRAVRSGTSARPEDTDPAHDTRVLAVAATGALAARLPALSGVDDAGASDEPQEQLLHAYAELLAARTRVPSRAERADLLAVAHLAAAAAAVGAAADPSLLLLAGVPADAQLRAAALLLAQTADDGGAAPEQLASEVRALFTPAG